MRRVATVLAFLTLTFGSGSARAGVILDFQDLAIPGETDLTFFTPYASQGFTLTATNPPTGFSAGFQAHGSNSAFYAGARGLSTFAPAAPPDNVIELTRTDGGPFSLLSIDLARNFAFDPAPTVTFTGTLAGGGTLTETFTVTTPSGTAAFQTFTFTGWADLVSVQWGQPVLAAGLHQFTNVSLDTPAAVPEPGTLLLAGVGLAFVAGRGLARRGRR